MTLEPRQRLLLRVADGLASADELGALRAEGIDVDALVRQQAALRDALALALSPTARPDVADAVMAALELPDSLGPALRQALAAPTGPDAALPGQVLDAVGLSDDSALVTALLRDALAAPAPDLADAVMASLAAEAAEADDIGAVLRDAIAEERGPAPDLADDLVAAAALSDGALSDDSAQVGALLRESLRPADAPDLADDIMAAIDQDGVLGDGASLGALLRDDPALDAPPDVADDVMAALGLAAPDGSLGDEDLPTEQVERPAAAVAPDGNVVPLAPAAAANRTPAIQDPVQAGRPGRKRPLRWALPALAAAAAAVMVVVTGSPTQRDDAMAFDLAAVNSVEIEELTAGDEVLVQVMQSDENAPTIIFIDEIEGGMPL